MSFNLVGHAAVLSHTGAVPRVLDQSCRLRTWMPFFVTLQIDVAHASRLLVSNKGEWCVAGGTWRIMQRAHTSSWGPGLQLQSVE